MCPHQSRNQPNEHDTVACCNVCGCLEYYALRAQHRLRGCSTANVLDLAHLVSHMELLVDPIFTEVATLSSAMEQNT
jgi:hypothetical protein